MDIDKQKRHKGACGYGFLMNMPQIRYGFLMGIWVS